MFSFRHALIPVGLVTLAGAVSVARSQVPVVPAAPVAPGAPAAAVPVVPTEPSPGFFGKMCLRLDACRRKIADTPLGQLLQNAKKPLSALTGGIVGGPLKPTDKEAAAPGIAGAAAAGKKDAAEAAKRREDVKFLGTLDCRYYPDAAKALADALRTDPSECVRFEAALGLGRGCCCSEVTVKALMASVSGTDQDGNPAERSARVRVAACAALERCLACYTPPAPEPEVVGKPVIKGEQDAVKGEGGGDDSDKQKDKKDPVKPDDKMTAKPRSQMPSKELIEKARQTIEEFQDLVAVSKPVIQPQVQPTPKSVFHLVQAAAVEPRPVNQQVQLATAQQPVAQQPVLKPALAAKPVPASKLIPAPPVAVTPAARMAPATAEPKVADVVPAPVATTTSEAATGSKPAVFWTNAKPAEAPSAAVPLADQQVKALSTKALQGADVAGQHEAIRELVRFDWKSHPLVASTLLLGAKTTSFKDAVRVDFIRHVAAYKVAHREVVDGMTALLMDADPWVRDEAAKAVEALTSGR
jgi:hypothetical protein